MIRGNKGDDIVHGIVFFMVEGDRGGQPHDAGVKIGIQIRRNGMGQCDPGKQDEIGAVDRHVPDDLADIVLVGISGPDQQVACGLDGLGPGGGAALRQRLIRTQNIRTHIIF